MKIASLAKEALVVSPEESISKVSSLLLKTRQAAVVVVDHDYKGVVFAQDLAKHSSNSPETEKIRNLMEPAPLLDINMSLEDAANVLVLNRADVLPVRKGITYAIIDKLDIIGVLKKHKAFSSVTAKDVMKPAMCVTRKQTLAEAVKILRDTGIVHLPVVDEKNKLEGIVDTVGFLKADVSRTRQRAGEARGNKIKLGNVSVASFMNKKRLTTLPNAKISTVIDKMLSTQSHTAIVVDSDTTMNVQGIITTTPLLKLVGHPVGGGGVYVNFSGFQDEDPFVMPGIDAAVTKCIQKVVKLVPVDYLVLHQDRFEEKKTHRMRHTVNARLITEKGFFFAHAEAWETGKAIKSVLDILLREVLKKKQKLRYR
ncbi:MAG: CBS domain-containing protein [Nanoarchaeota archaeon]|nr:CBS domain-containing protein [Nanoarchaeota archaeon]